jgi:hypothetical protein
MAAVREEESQEQRDVYARNASTTLSNQLCRDFRMMETSLYSSPWHSTGVV